MRCLFFVFVVSFGRGRGGGGPDGFLGAFVFIVSGPGGWVGGRGDLVWLEDVDVCLFL